MKITFHFNIYRKGPIDRNTGGASMRPINKTKKIEREVNSARDMRKALISAHAEANSVLKPKYRAVFSEFKPYVKEYYELMLGG